MLVFVIESQKVVDDFVTTGIRHALTHTICVHPLCLFAPPPSPAFSPPSHLYRWSAKMTVVMDGSGLQALYNVYLCGLTMVRTDPPRPR